MPSARLSDSMPSTRDIESYGQPSPWNQAGGAPRSIHNYPDSAQAHDDWGAADHLDDPDPEQTAFPAMTSGNEAIGADYRSSAPSQPGWAGAGVAAETVQQRQSASPAPSYGAYGGSTAYNGSSNAPRLSSGGGGGFGAVSYPDNGVIRSWSPMDGGAPLAGTGAAPAPLELAELGAGGYATEKNQLMNKYVNAESTPLGTLAHK